VTLGPGSPHGRGLGNPEGRRQLADEQGSADSGCRDDVKPVPDMVGRVACRQLPCGRPLSDYWLGDPEEVDDDQGLGLVVDAELH
jgi:hypothetical protein